MYPLIDWPQISGIVINENHRVLLNIGSENSEKIPQYTDLKEFVKKSDKFPIEFPIDTARCKSLKKHVSKSTLLKNINSAYPVLHERLLPLFVDFILHKRKFGSNVEREFYKDMSLLDLVDRLLKKRAVAFLDWQDQYLLLNGAKDFGGWEKIGKDDQTGHLILENCLSYDEIKLSAFLSISSYTHFINDGKRRNGGIVARDRGNLQEEGIIIGLIGARMEKENYMEYQELVIDDKQNNEGNGYGTTFAPTMHSLFSGFYEKPNWTYKNFLQSEERKRSGDFTELSKGEYFDNITFSKRIALSFDTLLFETNYRAKEQNVNAYVYVVGIGLGVWIISSHQKDIFLETFVKRVEYLGDYLHNVSDIHFGYFSPTKIAGKYEHGSTIPIKGHPNKGIRIFISRREPHEKLVGDNEGKLLVVSYAWDGNALPGNEYWIGALCASGDPAAASSTQVAEVHNPHINRYVSGRNLRIASRGNVYPFEDYIKKADTE